MSKKADAMWIGVNFEAFNRNFDTLETWRRTGVTNLQLLPILGRGNKLRGTAMSR
jgi:hypothetical protein